MIEMDAGVPIDHDHEHTSFGTGEAMRLRNARQRAMIEEQYDACLAAEPVTLGPMHSHSFRHDPKHLGFVLARYKFVAKMLAGKARVAEIGCGEGLGANLVRPEVGLLDLFDFDPVWVDEASKTNPGRVGQIDIAREAIGRRCYDAVYMIDVIEHIHHSAEQMAMGHIRNSMKTDGVLIVGTPSLKSQVYASAQSKVGHVNCRSGDQLRTDMQRYFRNVFLLCQNDEMIHVGFLPMAQYLWAICVGPR